MDGVLIDAKEWHYEALNRALKKKGYSPINRQDHLSVYDGLPTKDKLKKHPQTKDLSSIEHKEINDLKQKYTVEVIEDSCRPNHLLLETIKSLKERGYKMACCSNSIRRSVEMMLSKSGIMQYMDFFISNEDVEKGKPSPDMYNKAIEDMGLLSTEVLICEDNIRGITAGLDSGCFVLEIGTVDDTNIDNISKAILKIEGQELPEKLIRPSIRTSKLGDMVKGWFIGDFYPSIMRTKNFEAGVKEYKKGDKEDKHMHKVGTEITVIVRGKVIMCDRVLKQGEVILMEPGECTSFEALEDTTTFVIKDPAVKNDKYLTI